ncbi:hypothetical protein [Natrinema sp. SYSU A 869]|uniref:hypothetical protein n=1 Tax=Natrinema sp. SYSU A 869 TaxID=2871694 RepID=UPI001CA3A390|nr:hypothetical protein [Natrinema sp. SYSU A 869]
MPSVLLSRRRLLSASGGCLSVATAGCAGTESSDSATGTADDGVRVESSHEYEKKAVRVERDSPFVYPNDEAADHAEDGLGARLHASFFVTNTDDAAALRIDAPDADAADVRSFVEATDFAAESVLVDQRSIDDCYRRRLLGVRAADDSVRTSYCRELKAPTSACEAQKTVLEATLVRIHRPYEDHPSSRSSSESRSCSGRLPADATDGESTNETEANDTTTDETTVNESRKTDERNETNEVSDR